MCMASGNSPGAVSSALPGLYQQPPSLVLAVLDLLPWSTVWAVPGRSAAQGVLVSMGSAPWEGKKCSGSQGASLLPLLEQL